MSGGRSVGSPRARSPWVVMLVGAWLFALASAADPAGSALDRAITGSVLDPEVVEAIESVGSAAIVAVYARGPGVAVAARSDAARARLVGKGFEPRPRFHRLPVLAGRVDAGGLAALVDDPHLLRVSLEQPVHVQLSQSVPLVELDQLRAAGFTGSGADVAVVDTGVDRLHADLAGSILDEKCYCDDGQMGVAGCCPNGRTEDSGAGAAQDDHGHGTRVASIVTSDGIYADLGGAPDAGIVAVKVLSATGGGNTVDLLRALQWLLANHPGIPVVNLSLGFGLYPGSCDGADANTMAFASAIDDLWDAGSLVVAGSGNNGSGSGMIAPACLSGALSVGAVWDQDLGSETWFGCTDATTTPDQVTCWSNSSTETDVFAPGARVTSSSLSGTTVTLAGTSYATPMVSACAAILADEVPSATPGDLKTALTTSGVSVVDATSGLSFPRLDCVRAYHVLPEPSVGLQLASGLALLAALTRQRARRL